MSRLAQQIEWAPFLRGPRAIAVLDFRIEALAERFGWVWEEVDEEGLGPIFYVAPAWTGRCGSS